MNVSQEFRFTPASIRALSPALERANFGWKEINEWMQGHGWCIWNIGNQGYVFTLVNSDNELEVLLAGGSNARNCIKPWIEAVTAHPAHKGMTLRIEGRRGWQRLLPDFERRDGVLYREIA